MPSPSGNSIADKLGNDGKLTPKNINNVLTMTCVCIVVGLVISPRIVKKQLCLLPKQGPMWLKPWKKTKKPLLKVNLPSGLCTVQELCYGLLCSYGGTLPYASTLSYPYIFFSFPSLVTLFLSFFSLFLHQSPFSKTLGLFHFLTSKLTLYSFSFPSPDLAPFSLCFHIPFPIPFCFSCLQLVLCDSPLNL